MWLLAAARINPGSDVGSDTAVPSALRFTCPKPTLLPAAPAPRNSIPSAWSLSAVTSRMMASTNTWRRRTSSSPMMPASICQSAGVAETMSAFVASQATSSSNLSNLFTTIVRQDVGITLRLTPQIIADDFVRLTLFEEVSDIDVTATDVPDPKQVGPTTTVRSASTVVAAHDKQTVVIGGLLSDTVRAAETSVPYLRDVPVLGHLFRRNDDHRVKTNLLVFLTPHVISTDTQMAARSAVERAKLPRRVRESPAVLDHNWMPAPERHE